MDQLPLCPTEDGAYHWACALMGNRTRTGWAPEYFHLYSARPRSFWKCLHLPLCCCWKKAWLSMKLHMAGSTPLSPDECSGQGVTHSVGGAVHPLSTAQFFQQLPRTPPRPPPAPPLVTEPATSPEQLPGSLERLCSPCLWLLPPATLGACLALQRR